MKIQEIKEMECKYIMNNKKLYIKINIIELVFFKE